MAPLLPIYLFVIATVLSQRFPNPNEAGRDNDSALFQAIRVEYCGCQINVCAHGDDECEVAISSDGGMNYNFPTGVTGWQTPLIWQHDECISTDTRLRFEIDDNDASTRGGFIAGIWLQSEKCPDLGINGNTWVTMEDITNTFNPISTVGGSGLPNNYVYTDLGKGPWGTLNTCIKDYDFFGVEWVWNGQTGNTMTYIFSFADKELVLERCCEGVEIPPVPTPTSPDPVPCPTKTPVDVPSNATTYQPTSETSEPTRPPNDFPSDTRAPTTAPVGTLEPSVAPTIDDCCYEFESLESYIDRCYCNSTNTYTTTSAPVPTLPHTVSDMDNAQQSNVNGQFQQDVYSFMKRYDEFMINYNENKSHNDYIMYGFVGVNIILVMMNICCVLSYNNKKYRKKGYIQAMEDVDVDVEQDELVRT